jgi:hypothetical protein
MDVPLFELLTNGHHLNVLVLLDVVPGRGIRFSPNNYTTTWIQNSENENIMLLTMRTTRKAGEVPRTADYDGTHDDIAAR